VKKIPTRITPHTGGARENFNKKREKTVRKPKRHKSSRNSNARGHAQITRKVTSKIK
jgi:hypothetical protein